MAEISPALRDIERTIKSDDLESFRNDCKIALTPHYIRCIPVPQMPISETTETVTYRGSRDVFAAIAMAQHMKARSITLIDVAEENMEGTRESDIWRATDAERHDQVEAARTNPDRLSELWEHALYQRVDVVLQQNTGEDMGEPTQIALDRDDVSIRDGEEVSRLSRSDDERAPPPTGNNLELLAG